MTDLIEALSRAALLIVDDDPIVVQRFSYETLENTNLGVLTATSLTAAVSLLKGQLPIVAILTDVNFNKGRDEQHKLSTGYDLARYVSREHHGISTYCISMQPQPVVDAKSHGVRDFFDKLAPADRIPPWKRIETDVIQDYIKSNPHVRQTQNLVGAQSQIRSIESFNNPRLTYIQSSPDAEARRIQRPIPVHLRKIDQVFTAGAVSFPLLMDATGDTREDALSNLEAMLLEQYDILKENKDTLRGYAQFVFDKLSDHITD
jgi:hypothetical protein